MPVTIRKCSVAEIENAPNFAALLEEYALESAIAGIPQPSAKMEMYRLLEKSGGFHAFGAFEDHLIGFIGVLCAPSQHYGGNKIATCESYFVTKSRRSTGAGIRLRNAAKEFGKANDCSVILTVAKPGSDLDLMLMAKKECEHTNNVYCERL